MTAQLTHTNNQQRSFKRATNVLGALEIFWGGFWLFLVIKVVNSKSRLIKQAIAYDLGSTSKSVSYTSILGEHLFALIVFLFTIIAGIVLLFGKKAGWYLSAIAFSLNVLWLAQYFIY